MYSAIYKMIQHGFILSGREAGDSVYPKLKHAIESIGENDTLKISFAGVKMINTSFGDSSIGQIIVEINEGKYANRKIEFVDIENSVVQTGLDRIMEIVNESSLTTV